MSLQVPSTTETRRCHAATLEQKDNRDKVTYRDVDLRSVPEVRQEVAQPTVSSHEKFFALGGIDPLRAVDMILVEWSTTVENVVTRHVVTRGGLSGRQRTWLRSTLAASATIPVAQASSGTDQ